MFDTICDTKFTMLLIAEEMNDAKVDSALDVPEAMLLTKLLIPEVILLIKFDTKLAIELIADDTNDEIADNALAVPETIELTKLAIALMIVDTMFAPTEI